jgi:hypothetical protein
MKTELKMPFQKQSSNRGNRRLRAFLQLRDLKEFVPLRTIIADRQHSGMAFATACGGGGSCGGGGHCRKDEGSRRK